MNFKLTAWRWHFLFLFTISFSLFGISSVKAKGYNCDDPQAKWNQTIGGFSCQIISDDKKQSYTYITQVDGSIANCETEAQHAICPSGQRCVRLADCESALGGVCISDGTAGAPPPSDLDCSTSITNHTYTYKGIGPVKWQRSRFRCPDYNHKTCWLPIQSPTSESDLPTTPTLPPATTTPTIPAISITDCCRRIVPDPGTNPATGLPYEYTLNHVVQVAINVYECILCIVGALILAMLITGAIMMMISAGNPAFVNKGKQIISAAIIGGIIVFCSFLIINFVVKAVGAKFVNEARVEINPTGPSN